MKFETQKYLTTGKFTLLFSVLIGGCSMASGPAYDSAQDNPKNALPESIVLKITGNRDDRAIDNANSDKLPYTKGNHTEGIQTINTSDDDMVEYRKWIEAKESNSEVYQEFLEFQQWLEFRKNTKAPNTE